MLKILIIAYTRLDTDPRPNRQIRLLKDRYEIHSAGMAPSGCETRFFHLRKLSFQENLLRLPLLKLGLSSRYYWDRHKLDLVRTLAGQKYDLVIAHEIRLLPLALKIAGDAKVILDAHEYSPENFNDQFFWRFFIKNYYNNLCEQNLPQCHAMFTVCDGIAQRYHERFGVNPVVITNASEYVDLQPSPPDKSGRIRIIHHGCASPSRRLELMIEMMHHLDERFTLDLMLVYSSSGLLYYNKLKRLARGNPNIRFVAPVPFKKLVETTNKYDMGIQFHPPTNFNLKYGLGNKFFEFIQARLALAIGPAPEMARIVRKYGLGVVADDFQPLTLAKALNRLTADQIAHYKRRSHACARELSSQPNDAKIQNTVGQLIGGHRSDVTVVPNLVTEINHPAEKEND